MSARDHVEEGEIPGVAPEVVLRDEDQDLLKLLRAGQMLLVKYPVAARSAVAAFVAEGRRFAQTDEGRRWKEALAGTELVRRGRLVWEGCSLNMLEEDDRTVFPSVRYTGRTPSDPLGTLQAENVIQVGSGSQTLGLSRWGDYSAMTIDPVDDCTFWFTTEYMRERGTFNWSTRIASFKFPSCQ